MTARHKMKHGCSSHVCKQLKPTPKTVTVSFRPGKIIHIWISTMLLQQEPWNHKKQQKR